MEDSEPTDADVARLCQFELQTESPPEVQRVLEGGDNLVWFVNDDLVFRGLSTPQCDNRQARELRVRETVRRHCAKPAIIPRCVASGYWAERGIAFSLDSRINGLSLEEGVSADFRTETDLVLFLSVLKAVSLQDSGLANLPIHTEVDAETLKASAREAWRRMHRDGQLLFGDGYEDSLRLPNIRQPPFGAKDPRLVLVHEDLKGEHILLDKDTKAVVGILDWTDVKVGDPATDVAGLAICVGSTMAARIGFEVGYSEAVVARAILIARCNALLVLEERLNGEDDSPIDLLRKQLDLALQPADLSAGVK